MYSVIWFYHSYTIQNIIIYAIHCEQHVAFVCENNNFPPSFSTFFKNLILHKNLCCCLSFHICMEYSSLKKSTYVHTVGKKVQTKNLCNQMNQFNFTNFLFSKKPLKMIYKKIREIFSHFIWMKSFLGSGLFKNCLTRCKFILQTFNSSIIVEAI